MESDGLEALDEELKKTQTLKAAIHFTVGRLCEEVGAERDLTFSRHVIATLSELTARQLQTYALDLEAFANHARRKTIINDDVKLLVRRNTQMSEHIKTMTGSEEEDTNKKKKKKRGRPRKTSEAKNSDQPIEVVE